MFPAKVVLAIKNKELKAISSFTQNLIVAVPAAAHRDDRVVPKKAMEAIDREFPQVAHRR